MATEVVAQPRDVVERMKKLLIFVLLLPVLFLGFHPDSGNAQEKRVVVGYTARDLNNFPLFAAQAKGFFREVGINPELVQVRSTVGLAGLLTGSVDYNTSFSSAIRWAAQGSPVVGVMSMVDRPNFYLIVRPEIRNVTDLRGKAVGVGAVGAINDIITRKMLAHFGVGPDEVTMMGIGDLPVRMAALRSGSIQATTAPPPAPIQAKEMGLNVLAFAGDIVELPLAGLSTTTAKLKSVRSEVVSIVTAVLRGLLFIRNRRQESVALMQKIFKMDRGAAEASYDLSVKSYSVDGSASLAGIQSVLDIGRTQAGNRRVTPSDVVDFGPLREAEAALGIR